MCKLSDYINKTVDNRGRNPKYLSCGEYPVIDNVLIKNTLYPNIGEATRFLDQELYDNFLRGYVHRNMPIMTLVGNGIANVTLAPSDKVAIVQNTIGFDVNDRLDEVFLFYYLIYNRERIKNFNRGSGQPSIRKTDILGMEVDIPPLDIQKKIVSVLYRIDKKIHINGVVNENLEQQAFAIFASRFSKVSEGDKTIGDYIIPCRGKNLLSKDAISGSVPVVAGGLEPSTYHNVSNTQSPVLTISASGANSGFVRLWNQPVWSSDSSYIDSGMTEDVYFWYAMLKLRQKEIYDSQTGSAQPHIYPKHIAAMPVTNLDKDEMTTYSRLVTPLFNMIGSNVRENQRLADIRDALLPKLMSGELNVSELDI